MKLPTPLSKVWAEHVVAVGLICAIFVIGGWRWLAILSG